MENFIASVANMTEEEWQAFGAWLKHQRELADVPQVAVAKKANIHVVQLSRIENGHSGVKRDNLVLLVDAINELTKGHTINKDEALKKAGFALTGADNVTINVGEDVRLILLDKDVSPEDQEEYERAVALAVAMAKQRIADKRKNQGPS
jgi:transcriptional regulator with XRE-family HTH domain